MSRVMRRLKLFTLFIVLLLLNAACGQSAAPTGSAPTVAGVATSGIAAETQPAGVATNGTAAETTATPTMKIVTPTDGATVKGPKVTVEVAVTNWKLVPAGSPLVEGEGHLHFFIDVPASSVAVGKVIPPTETDPAYVHVGKAPFTSRDLMLKPGKHTITVVMGNASHLALARPAPQSITITVE